MRDRQALPLVAAEKDRVRTGAARPCTKTPNTFDVKCQRQAGHPGCCFASDDSGFEMRWSQKGERMKPLYPKGTEP